MSFVKCAVLRSMGRSCKIVLPFKVYPAERINMKRPYYQAIVCSPWSFLQGKILRLTTEDPSIRKISGGTCAWGQNFREGEIFCLYPLFLSQLFAGVVGICVWWTSVFAAQLLCFVWSHSKVRICIFDSICCHGNASPITHMALRWLCRAEDEAHKHCESLVVTANLQW